MSASYQTVVSGQGGCCRPHAESDPGLGRGARAHPGRVPGRTWDAKPGDGVSGRGPRPQDLSMGLHFGDRIFEELIKVKRGHWGGAYPGRLASHRE